MSNLADKLRKPREKIYGGAMLVLGAVLWAFIAWGVWYALTGGSSRAKTAVLVYGFYALAFVAFYWISSAVYRATAFGNMILLGSNQLPELHAMVLDGARALGMKQAPKTFLFNSNGLINAFARRLLGGRYVFLTSGLVDCNDDQQVRFVIGHELGHHAAGHLDPVTNIIKLPAYVIPFLQPAYSRAREYTCDSIGAHLAESREISRGALQMLGCGCARLNQQMNCEAFMAQEAMVPPIFGFISEIFRSHPRLTRRVLALR